MKNDTDLMVTQIRIFPVDIIPISRIATKSCVEKVTQALSFSEVDVRPFIEGKNVIVLRRGELRKEKRAIVINRIEVDPRRMIVEVDGTSLEGNEVFESFLSTIASVADIDLEKLHKPLLLAETTQCVISLDFSFDSLFSSAFIEFLKRKVEKEAKSNVAKASIRPLIATAEITYEITDPALTENKVTMNPKQFSITPRPGAPLEANKYLVSSPFDSETHLRLLKELNRIITSRGKQQ